MGRRRYKPEEIISKLRKVDVLSARRTPVVEAIRSIGVTREVPAA
jgi:putative transposase